MMKTSYLFLFILVFTSLFIHLYKLSTIPPGLSNDEANIGYEAWSIATTGRDQWGRPWPLVFEGFGNWSLPVYIYLTAPLIYLFGPSAISVRLLSAVSGVLITVFTYLLVRYVRPKKPFMAWAASFLTAFTPWIIGLSRTATEAPLAMAFFLAGLFTFLKADKRLAWMLLSGFLALASVFTYYAMWVFVPLYWGTILWFFRKQLTARFDSTSTARRVSRKLLAIIGSIGGLGIFLIINQQGGITRLQQVNLSGNPTIIGALNEERGACELAYPSLFCKVVFNRPIRFGSEFLNNYLSHFSLREWFLTNDAKGILPPGGYFFPIIAPFFALGLRQLIVKGTREEKVIFLPWLALVPLADSLTGAGNFTRAFPMAPVIVIIAGYGLVGLGNWLGVFGVLGVLGMFGQFVLLYTSYFPMKHSPFTHYEYQPLISILRDEKQVPIFISSAVRDTKQYMFYLWYAKILPRYFQKSAAVVRGSDQGAWLWVKQVDNWHFMKKIPELSELPLEAIIVGAWKEEIVPFVEMLETCDGSSRFVQIVEYLNDDPAFAIARFQKSVNGDCIVNSKIY